MGEATRREREWEENGEGMQVRQMGMHEIIAPKRNIFRI